MRIAIWHNLPSGGGKRALYDQVRGLVERGHVVEAWCPETADQTFLPLGQHIAEHVRPFPWRPRRSINPIARLVSPYHQVVGKIRAMDQHCQQCAEEINRGHFDLLFAHPCMFFRVTAIGRYVELPKVIYLQEPFRPLYEAMPRLPWTAPLAPGGSWWKPRYYRSILRDAIHLHALRVQAREELANARAFDAILVNSLFSRENILRAYGLDARLCYLGIDTARFADLRLEREQFIVGIGAFVREKNIGFVIESLAAVSEPRPRLVWVGNVAVPSYVEELKQLARSAGVDFEPRIRAGDAEIVDLLNRATAMVYAPRLEPFGFAPLEANACGTPVVAIAEGGVRETIVDGVNGLLVEPDPRAMARAIEQLRDDPAYARRLGEQAYRHVHERWTLGASIDRLERRFAEALDARRP